MRAALLVAMLVLSGCLSGSDAGPDIDQVEADVLDATAPFLVQTHGGDASEHFDATLHAAAENVRRIGYHNGEDDSGNPNNIPAGVYYTELAVHEGYVYLARVSGGAAVTPTGPVEQEGGFVIIDARNPTNPRFAGEFKGLNGFDIDVSHDGALAFFSSQRNSIEEILGNAAAQDQPGPGSFAARGVYIVDVRDKTAPALTQFLAMPYNGPHTTTYYKAGDRELLFVQTYDLTTSASPASTLPLPAPMAVNPITQRVSIYELQRSQEGDRLDVAAVQIGHFQLPAPPGDELVFPHDVYVEVHPQRGDLLAYVAYWDAGVQIVDLSGLPAAGSTDPQNPVLTATGSFREFSPSGENAIHLAKPFRTPIAGRHITVAEPEIIQADETGQITFIDTSNPGRPVKACENSYWSLPGDLSVNNFDFSPHNFDTFDGHVALAHNHAGIWIIDVHDEERLCDPATTGAYMQTVQRDDAPQMQPRFWGVFEEMGYLYASDMSTGLYILEYTGP